MKTQILLPTDENIQKAAEALKEGKLVGIPTETVYGLSANSFDESAVHDIFKAKGREADNPLIVHIHTPSMLEDFAEKPSNLAMRLIERFWPGPLTIVLPKKKTVPSVVTAGMDTVAIRFPSHPVTRRLIECAGFGLAAPSANLSGKPSPTRAEHVYNDLKGKLPYILDGGPCQIGLESTVVKVDGDLITLLRPGGITLEMLREVGEVKLSSAILNPVNLGQKVESPGMKYKHYAPKAQVILVKGEKRKVDEYIKNHAKKSDCVFSQGKKRGDEKGQYILYGATPREQAQNLFDGLRRADKLNAGRVYIACPPKDGLSLALLNRLLRASAFHVVDLIKE